jgi:enoyl-[acyl-carrier protein] reductase I
MQHSILDGKRGIIFGALDENSIAWQVALTCREAGATFTLTNAPVAIRMGSIHQLAEQCQAVVIPADATSVDDLKHLFEESIRVLDGNIDFILHAVGMSPNVRKNKSYTDLNYDFYQKTLDISAISFHKILQTAWKLDALSEGASVVALSFIAAQKVYPGYGDMAEAKAALESIARNFGYYYGKKKKVRINTISQSPTKTTAGSGISGFESFFKHTEELAPLGNATAQDCARLCVMLFSDYTRMLTMQNIFHDGGYSSMGMTEIS